MKNPYYKFSIALLAAMFLPRVIPEGMFFDGLIYASIGRNLAIGLGDLWHPFFSTSYTLPQHIEGVTYFYGHPPLSYWLIALCYHILGDHWFVEKGFCITVWILTVLLVKKLSGQSPYPTLSWLVLIVWYLSPAVLWSYPYFLHDNLMGVFSLSASLVLIEAMKNKSSLSFADILLSSALLHLAFLTKGPVGLYPLATPFLFAICLKEKKDYVNGLLKSVLLTLTTGVSLLIWYFYMPARDFFYNYYHTQIESSILHNEHTLEYSLRDYTLLYENIGLTLIPVGILFLIVFSITKINSKRKLIFSNTAHRWALFYISMALAGSLPMSISHKTSWYYLIPCSPFYALGGVMLVAPTLTNWFSQNKLHFQSAKHLNVFANVVLAGVSLYCLSCIGTIEREKDLIHDIKLLQRTFKSGATIPVSESVLNDYEVHAYFQRYARWELANVQPNTVSFLTKAAIVSPIDSVLMHDNGYKRDTSLRLVHFNWFVK